MILGTRLWFVAFALLLCTPQMQCRNVTLEDIRDAMLSLVHMFRTSEDKLERHEYREKALGDQTKKMLVGLDKKHRALEPLKGMISRLDERLSNVETILLQKEEREKATQNKIQETLELIQKSLPSANKVTDNLTVSGGSVEKQLDATHKKLDEVKAEILAVKSGLTPDSLRAICNNAAPDANPLQKHLTEAEKLLNRYELKLNEYNGTKIQPDVVQLSEVSLADEAWHNKMTEVMERQEREIVKIQHLLSDAESVWKDLPHINDIKLATNITLRMVDNTALRLAERAETALLGVTNKIRDMNDRLLATNEDIQRSLTQGNTMSERAYGDITRSYETLRNEVSTMAKNEHVMLQTADNVIATKKRIEYGVHQILMEVGELVKLQGKNLNGTIHDRFTHIEETIVANQVGALSNLSSKIESEMSQVWRQIGIMHTQITASKLTLDKLTNQTQQYVNGSTTVLDGMMTKVGMITTRMIEVDDNLNYLLGRLAMVTQEFGQIKAGLSNALDKVNESFRTVKEKIDDKLLSDKGPGPHKITSEEKAA